MVLLLALGSVGAGTLSPWFIVLGGLLLHVVLVLDNIDGCIAQSTGTETAFGSFADAFVAWFHYTTLPLCLGFAVSRMDPEFLRAAFRLRFHPIDGRGGLSFRVVWSSPAGQSDLGD